MDLEAFLTKRAMKSLAIRVQIRSMGRNQHSGSPQARRSQRDLCGREIAAAGEASQAGVSIKGEHDRQAVLAEKLGHHARQRASASKRAPTCRCSQMEVPASTRVGHLDDLCPLADRGSAGTRLSSFKSNWTSSPGCRSSSGLGLRRPCWIQPACRRIFQMVGGSARQAHPGRFECRIMVEERQDGFRPWDALQILGRLDADLEDAALRQRVGSQR